MVDRRGSRFLLEALFLIGLALALAFARLDALVIVGVMVLGWLVVAALEWAAWRGEAHYGSGMPPRYFVPTLKLPPAQPLEQVDQGYPGASREEAPTWIASAALRAEVLGEWPVAVPAPPEDEDEDEVEDGVEDAPGPGEPDPWTIVSLPAAPLDEPEEPPEPEPEPEPVPEPEPEPVQPAPPPVQPAAAEPARTARHRLDPLAEPSGRRRFGRGRAQDTFGVVDVPARPTGVRPLPGSAPRR